MKLHWKKNVVCDKKIQNFEKFNSLTIVQFPFEDLKDFLTESLNKK